MGYKAEANPDLEASGVWTEYDDGEFEVLIARAGGGNLKFKQAMERQTKPIRRALEADLVGEPKLEKILIEAYADTVILGWRCRGDDPKAPLLANKMRGVDGSIVDFNRENVIAFLNDVRFNYYWVDFRRVAQSGVQFRKELQSNDKGNWPAS